MANSQMLSGNTTYMAGFWDDSYKTQLLGIVIAIAGNFLISISLNLQKYTHVRLSRQKDPEPYYKSVLWWCAIILMGIGELGNFAAYGFAPATLVAPLGCVSVIASAVISVAFLKETLRASDLLGGALAISGTYLLVTFAPNISQNITAFKVQKYLVSWQFLVYLFFEIIVFCILLYLYKKKDLKHIVVVLMLVALLASLTVISVKAVAGMITESVKGHLQLTYPIFYVMLIIMVASCAFQVKFLNQAMEIFDATEVVPINFVFFTASAIIAVLSGCFYSSSKMASHVFLRTTFPIILLVTGVIFYQEFYGVALLNIFMFLFGILLSFLGVFLITRNRERKKSEVPFIDIDQVPGQKSMDKIQPDASSISYGSLDAEAKPLGNKDGELKDTASNLLSSHKP